MDENVNILDAWKRHFDAISSPFNPKRVFHREHVDFVYDIIRDFWGKDFFQTTRKEVIEHAQDHFLFPMLGTNTFAAFYYLTELCLLIAYAKERYSQLYDNLYSNRFLSDKAKEAFFELYIAFIFELNGIPHVANVLEQDQWKDGYCMLKEEIFLVECKKKYSVIADEIAIRKYLMKEILKIANRTKYGFEGIGIVTIKTDTYFKNTFLPVIKAFKNYLTTRTDYRPEKVIEDDTIRFEIKAFNDANRIELENNLIDYTLYFTVQNLYRSEGDDHFFRIQLYFKAKAPGDKVAKKLISAISKARKQHAKDKERGRVFFIDNEYLNDFVTPLLNYTESYEKTIKEYLEKKTTRDIIVLITRNYTAMFPVIKSIVIAKDELKEQKNVLESMTYEAIHRNFFKEPFPKPESTAGAQK